MKWPWRRGGARDPDDSPGLEAAKRARESAECLLSEVRERSEEVRRVAESLRSIRKRNHLADIVEASIRERGNEGDA